MTRDELEATVWLSAPYLPRPIVDTIMAAADRYARDTARAEIAAAAHRRGVLDAELAAVEQRGRWPRARAA